MSQQSELPNYKDPSTNPYGFEEQDQALKDEINASLNRTKSYLDAHSAIETKSKIRLAYFLFSLLFIHILLAMNKTYTVTNSGTYDTENMGSSQYKEYVKSVDKDYRSDIIKNSTMTYFDVLPGWTINAVYVSYFLLAFISIRKVKSYMS